MALFTAWYADSHAWLIKPALGHVACGLGDGWLRLAMVGAGWLAVCCVVCVCCEAGDVGSGGFIENCAILHLNSLLCLVFVWLCVVAGGGLRQWQGIHQQDIHWRSEFPTGGDGGVRCERLSLKQAPPINPDCLLLVGGRVSLTGFLKGS
jgi:hypothetical protein